MVCENGKATLLNYWNSISNKICILLHFSIKVKLKIYGLYKIVRKLYNWKGRNNLKGLFL